jgi:hypothetical protein
MPGQLWEINREVCRLWGINQLVPRNLPIDFFLFFFLLDDIMSNCLL